MDRKSSFYLALEPEVVLWVMYFRDGISLNGKRGIQSQKLPGCESDEIPYYRRV